MKNPFSKLRRKIETTKGYTLLFSVIVSVLVLSVAAFILSISRKQFVLSSAARDSMYAFYAADSGIECAVENKDTLTQAAIAAGNNISFSCDAQGLTATPVQQPPPSNAGATTTWQMAIPAGTNTCAIISVWFYTDNPDGTGGVHYFVDSRGYNIGWNGSTCNGYGSRRVERAVRYSINE